MIKRIMSMVVLGLLIFTGCSDDAPGGVSFANPTPAARDCTITNSFVGQTMPLRVSSLYGISGDVTIISDCEIQITNFFYNGLGPNVSFYGAVDGDYRGGVNMSDILNGRTWEGETLNLFVPEGFSIGEINSFSVWCFEFDVDFSSTFFN